MSKSGGHDSSPSLGGSGGDMYADTDLLLSIDNNKKEALEIL